MPPHESFYDGDEVSFSSQPIAARFGPAVGTNSSSKSLIDVTEGLKQLIARGRTRFVGGIETALKIDPAPGVPKVLHVWYGNRPDASYSDFATVTFQTLNIIAAHYSMAKDVRSENFDKFNDVTEKVRKLVQSGRTVVEGGIFTALGDPFPGMEKTFQVWYY